MSNCLQLSMVKALVAAVAVLAPLAWADEVKTSNDAHPSNAWQNAAQMLARGRHTFRFDNFGNQDFWGGKLGLHRAIAGEQFGGVGPGVSPATALKVGLKVDQNMLPKSLVQAVRRGDVDLNSPATTLTLLRLNAVVGVRGFFDERGRIQSVGITCAICHSTVDNAFVAGIGNRLDGWANRDLNIGAIVALSPSVAPFTQLLGVDDATVRAVFNSWGPGKFDAALLLDGKAFVSPGKSAATLIPPAFGLAGVNMHTWTGWGSVTHWNAFVAVLEMQGKGTFYDPRLNDSTKFPIAAANGFANVRNDPDLVTSKLGALQFYQLAIPAPAAPRGSFDDAPRNAARHCSPQTARRVAQPAMCRHSLQSPAGTCTPRRSRHRRFPGRASPGRSLSHLTVAWPVDSHQGRLLSRWSVRDPAGRRQSLRQLPDLASDRTGEEGPG